MPKSTSILIGHTFLGILILFSLLPFNLTPSLAAQTAQASGRKRNLRDEHGVETFAGERPYAPPAEASTPMVNPTFRGTVPTLRDTIENEIRSQKVHFSTPYQVIYEGDKLNENSNTITAQGANFVVHYNPTGDCKTTGLKNFIPSGTVTAWTQPAIDAFEHALSIWSMVLNANQTIVINVCWVNPGNTNVLGTGQPVSVFADFTGAISPTTMYPVALANELAGSDLNDNDGVDHDGDGNNADAEITIAFNSNPGITWYFGTDSNPPAGQKDFVTAALHEVAHGLGFVSSMFVDTGDNICGTGTPGDGCWGTGTGLNNMPLIYDRFLENGAGQNLIQTFANKSAALGTELTTAHVRFNGPNAKAADNNSRPRLYTPNTFDLGSSILHLDNINKYKNGPNRLMMPNAGDPQHHPGPITLGILKDIGWNIIDLPQATLTKSASATSVAGGQVLTYTLTVTNTGYLMMTDVTITDTVPPGTTLDTDSFDSGDVTTSGTTPGSLMTWTTNVSLSTINTLSRTFAVTVSLEPGLPAITNTAYVTSSAGVGADDTISTTVVGGSNNVFLPIILSN